MAQHPYFQKKAQDKSLSKQGDNGEGDLFWDGFQWVPRQR